MSKYVSDAKTHFVNFNIRYIYRKNSPGIQIGLYQGQGQWRIQKILVGGDLKHKTKTSKIRMSSPKLRVIFRRKSEIQTFFSPKFRWSPKKKKKRSSPKLRLIFRPKSEIQTFFSPKFRWSPKKKVFTKIETDFSPDSLR